MILNQKGAFNLTGPTVIIIGFIIFCFLGYVIFGGGGNSDQTKDPDSTMVSKITTPTNINNTNNLPKSVQITALNLQVTDPENRHLVVDTVNVSTASTSSSSSSTQTEKPGYFIHDSNTDYFSRCQYPVQVTEVPYGTDSSHDPSPFIKQINGKQYYVGSGTYDSKPCPSTKPDDANYINILKNYVANNLKAI